MSFNLYTSNHLKILAYLLKNSLIAENGAEVTPLEMIKQRRIVVQTPGMGTWLKLYLADQCGVMANVDFPFLQAFIQNTLSKHPDIKEKKLSKAHETPWRIYRELLNNGAQYPEIQAYVSGEDADLKRWQISCELAFLFDQYQAFIPNEMMRWRHLEGEGTHWQQCLYAAIFKDELGRDEALDIFKISPFYPQNECQIITLFGISAMPPLQLEFFKALSKVCRVDLYYLNPSDTNWTSCGSRVERFEDQMRLLFSGEKPIKKSGYYSHSISNPILAQCGELGRAFLQQITADDFHFHVNNDWFLAGCNETMLSTLQSDILMNETPEEKYLKKDDSLSIHNCHSPLREIEVLHDQILRTLEVSSGAIQPRDILVMAPDIQRYEPYIEDVFGAGPLKEQYSITDRQFKSSSHVCELFLRIISFCKTRFTFTDVMELFQAECIMTHYKISSVQYEQLCKWIQNSGVRWGEDAHMHETFSGYPFTEYAWNQGFERLFMGVALHPTFFEEYELTHAPLDEIEGDSVEALGQFKLFVDSLFLFSKKINQSHAIADWKLILKEVLNTFFERNKQTLDEFLMIETAFENMPETMAEQKVPYSVIEAYLQTSMESTFSSGGFLRGTITFCTMVPMRSIPRKVICILGLNNHEFPRKEKKSTFNLLINSPQFSEKCFYKTRQAEDRFLFLEAILSAEEKLILSYNGQDSKSNAIFPPATPLSELIDYLEARFNFKEIKHRLQSFSKYYFQNHADYFTYDKIAYQIALEFQKQYDYKDILYAPKPQDLDVELKQLELSTFERCLIHPIAYHLEYVSGINFSTYQDLNAEDCERFSLSSLDEYDLKQRIVDYSICKNKTKEEQLALLKRKNLLPIFSNPPKALEVIFNCVDSLSENWKRSIKNKCDTLFTLDVGDIQLTGILPLSDGIQYYTRFSTLKSKDLIVVWIRHLIINIVYGSKESYILEIEKGNQLQSQLNPILKDDALKLLKELICVYKMTFSHIIPFFPKASLAYAKEKNYESRWSAALKKMLTSDRYSGELEEEVMSRCFDSDHLPNREEFEKYAQILLAPFYTGLNKYLVYLPLEDK